MTSQTLVSKPQRIINSFGPDNSFISYYKKEISDDCENKSLFDDAPLTISCNINAHLDISPFSSVYENFSNLFDISFKSGTSIPNPYKIENLFTEIFLKSLFNGSNEITEDIAKIEINSDGKIFSKPIHSMKNISNLDLMNSAISESKKWATWKQPEIPVLNQSKHLLGELSVAQYISKNESIPLNTAQNHNEFLPSNNNPDSFSKTTKSLKEKHVAIEAISKPVFVTTLADSNCFTETLAVKSFKRLFLSMESSKIALTANEGPTMKNGMIKFEDMVEKHISSIAKSCFNHSKKSKAPQLKWEPKLSLTGDESEVLENKKFTPEQDFSSIMQDNSNPDLKKLENEINLDHSSYADSFQSVDKFDCVSSIWNRYQIYDSDDCLSQSIPEECSSYDNHFSEWKFKSKTSEDVYPGIRRSRVDSGDSGISLDTNSEAILPEESDLSEKSNFSDSKTEFSEEFISGLNSTKPSSYLDDIMRECHLCKKVILNKYSLTCRFGLLMNCLHSFCYYCIRNHSKSTILSTGLVKCPKCNKPSPGIVPSPRWIKDKFEKTALFQEYYKESEFFHRQEQVFENIPLFEIRGYL